MGLGEIIAPTGAKVALSILLVLCYLNPWVFGFPLIGLLLLIYLPLKYAALALNPVMPGLVQCEGGACFPNSPLMVLAAFMYTYLILGLAMVFIGSVSRAARFEIAGGKT